MHLSLNYIKFFCFSFSLFWLLFLHIASQLLLLCYYYIRLSIRMFRPRTSMRTLKRKERRRRYESVNKQTRDAEPTLEYAEFKILKILTMKNTVFWDMMPSQVELHRRFGVMCSLLFRIEEEIKQPARSKECLFLPGGLLDLQFYPKDRESTFLRNVCELTHYPASHIRRQ
jgi:hypothetical protein